MKDSISIVSNVFIRQMELEGVGDFVQGHSHTFDHQHLLVAGTVAITVAGKTSEYTAPHTIFIAKGKQHMMVAVTDYALGYCIHPIRTGYRVEDIADPKDLSETGESLIVGKTVIDTINDKSEVIITPERPWNIEDEH